MVGQPCPCCFRACRLKSSEMYEKSGVRISYTLAAVVIVLVIVLTTLQEAS